MKMDWSNPEDVYIYHARKGDVEKVKELLGIGPYFHHFGPNEL